MQLKKVINKYKFFRIKNNHRTYLCNVSTRLSEDKQVVYSVGFLLDDHLYVATEEGVYPHIRFSYYAYYVGEIGGVHYRSDQIMFYKITLANPF